LVAAAGADPDEAPSLADALLELTAHLGVYRTYVTERGMSVADRAAIDDAAARSGHARADLRAAIDAVRRVLLRDAVGAGSDLVRRWQQFTGPVMAKGVEDTAFYADNRFLALNDVGIDPSARAGGVPLFHQRNLRTQARWPAAISATGTHDAKHSEDIRARLAVLSEIPERWAQQIARWREAAAALKPRVRGAAVPGPNMELHIYQTLLGAWPLADDGLDAFRERIARYVVKAAREIKLRTSWLSPDEHYERALVRFTASLLDPAAGAGFLARFLPFQREIAYAGMLNALSQVLLKTASPGVPDFYQGTEGWTLDLVDPDNRRPVDFAQRRAMLDALLPQVAQPDPRAVEVLLAAWPDGRIKCYVTMIGLRLRRQHREVFAAGAYLPLAVTGPHAAHLCAFARRSGQTWIVAAVPRMVMRLTGPQRLPIGASVWADTALTLPGDAPRRWHDALTGMPVDARAGIPAGELFACFPGALVVGRAP
jgi:(1->4)-alpha-D-glucan 1-alpha-D-glucosylmutase